MEPVQVRMLGEFEIQSGDVILRESENRSRRLFCLLSFLICHREHPVSQYKLIRALWGDHAHIANPENTLRLLMHRARSLLDQLCEGAGRECILRKDGSYCWNPNVPMVIDYDRFEQLCQSRAIAPEDRLSDLTEALSLYQGEFLLRHSSDSWVIPIASHFQNLYLQASLEAAQLLLHLQRCPEAAAICHRALAVEPYSESACQLLMQIHIAMNKPQAATEVYETLKNRLFDDLGIHPSPQTNSLYRSLIHGPEAGIMTIEEILLHLQEPEFTSSPLQCDYDYFKMLCYAHGRASGPDSIPTYVALLSITGTAETPLHQRALRRIMTLMGQILRSNLRRYDVLCQCSPSQYVFLLPRTNYESSCMICSRVIAAFQKRHPSADVGIHYLTHPLIPGKPLL